MRKRLLLIAPLATVGACLLTFDHWHHPSGVRSKGPYCDRPHSFDDLRVWVESVDLARPRICIAMENRTGRSLWTYQTDDGRCQEPLHQSSADHTNDAERSEDFGYRTCIPPMVERPTNQVIRSAYSHRDRLRIAEFGPPAFVEIPAGTTLRREIRWPPTVPDSLIVQVGYGYSEPNFQEWMGGSEWQWARVFEWQHVAASLPFTVPPGR